MLEKVVRVTREEFETESGNVYPIDPPLEEDVTPGQIQVSLDAQSKYP